MLTKWILFGALCFLLCTCDQEEKLSIAFGGDVMLDRGVRTQIQKHGINYLLEDVAPVFQSADFTVVNVECPVTEIQSPLAKKFIFRGEPEWLPLLHKSGITHGVLANNHSYDHGRKALISTEENLTKSGIVPVGYGLNQRKACEPSLMQKNGVKVAIFSSVLLGLEAWMYLENEPGMCQATVNDLVMKIKEYKKENSDTKVVVTLHWGNEYELVPPLLQKMEARRLIKAGADAIIGHHPHVVQRFEWIEGKPVFYSLGNLLFDNQNPLTLQGILIKLTFHKDKTEPEVIPYEVNQVKPYLMNSEEGKLFVSKWQEISDKLPKVKFQ